jgi:putative membrane protein
MQNRSIIDYLIITLKGMAMGAADVVPGVSGGTIAFISGIYDELLDSINTVNFKLYKILKEEGFKKVWETVNANFLVALLLGILLSVLSLAKILSTLLEQHPILVWSFFFGLVLASILFVGKQIKNWTFWTFLSVIIGILAAYFITQIQPAIGAEPSIFYLILSGSLAICAMILPGISGSFILVLLGMYQIVLNAVHQREFNKLFFIIIGAVVGLLTFSRILKYVLDHYRNSTLALLTGFIIGALNKIWPWKEVLEILQIDGKVIVLKDKSISPFQYVGDNQIVYAIALASFGFLLIILLEKWGQRQT